MGKPHIGMSLPPTQRAFNSIYNIDITLRKTYACIGIPDEGRICFPGNFLDEIFVFSYTYRVSFKWCRNQKWNVKKWLRLEYNYKSYFLENSFIGSHLKFSIFYD